MSSAGQAGNAGEDAQAVARPGVWEIKAQILNITSLFGSREGKAVLVLGKHVLAGR